MSIEARDTAWRYWVQSCRMDLDDVNLDTERGVHGSGGAVWRTRAIRRLATAATGAVHDVPGRR